MEKYQGNGNVEDRLDRIERWIVAHEQWCQGHFSMTDESMRRNERDHGEIKTELKEVHKRLEHINLYIGGAIVVATVLGHLATEILANALK